MEQEQLYEILNEWNFWEKDFPHLYTRQEYEDLLSLYDKTDEITIVKGIRRSGKSSVLINHIKTLLQRGVDKSQILFINFEDPRFINDLNVDLLDQLFSTYQEYVNNSKKPFVFLDEVQEIPGWEKWVRTKYELQQIEKLYITGSSSKLLSFEFGTALSGRYLDIDVYPLSFKEFLQFREKNIPSQKQIISNKIEYKRLFNEFFEQGGFPKIILTDKELQKKEILTYYESIILKDIVTRYHLKNAENVKKVAFYLITNSGKPTNINAIKKALSISYDLVENYIEYLKECYLLYEVIEYNASLKKQLISQKKFYTIDLAFNTTVGFKFSEDKGRLLENLVFIELKKQGFDVYYHREKKECDFIIKQNLDITKAIQVTTSLEQIETKKREVSGLIEACKKYNLDTGIIITQNEEQEFVEDNIVVKVIPMWKWLLN